MASYGRTRIEISAMNDLKETITIATTNIYEGEKTFDVVIVEYEWRPPC